MHRRISTFTRPFDDDDGHPTAWRLQCTPLIMALIFNRYERHQPGEYDQRHQLRHPQLGHPTRLPGNATPSSPDVSLASASLTGKQRQLWVQMAPSSTPSLHRNYVNLKKANWERYSKDIEETLSTEPDPTDCQQGEKILRAAILKSASHHIPSGRHKLDHTEALQADIVDMMSARDDLRSRDPTSPALSQMNDEINQAKNRHKRDKWRTFVETLDHKAASSKLWRTIKTLDGKSTQTAENEAITFNGYQVSSPKQIANRFNEQFTTSKLGRHNSSRETRLVSREVRRNPKETTVTFTTDLVTRAIRSCSNTKAFGPDKLSIFHLKHLGPRATAYLTALFNDSVNSSRITAIWKSSIVIPIPKPGKDSSQGTSYRPISLICPAAKVLEALILPTVNAHLLPADDQHGFRPGHSTTSALLQLTTNIATGFNQKKPPHRTVCVAVDLTAAFDTVSHNVLISKISRSTLPEVTCRWLSCYLRGRQAVTSCRGVKSSARIVHTGVIQSSGSATRTTYPFGHQERRYRN